MGNLRVERKRESKTAGKDRTQPNLFFADEIDKWWWDWWRERTTPTWVEVRQSDQRIRRWTGMTTSERKRFEAPPEPIKSQQLR
ncbi:MAG: hypothetical protein AAGJ83_06025 [Planctomycetota bacterium]